MSKTPNLADQLADQQFANGYELVDGVAMHEQNGARFQIPHPVLKKHIGIGFFVELRIDSQRFSTHPDAPENCTCPHCDETASKPILGHDQPASLVAVPPQDVPSRGWGEDFWAQVLQRDGDYFLGIVDNPLHEARLHGLGEGDRILFHANHVLAVHPVHREQMVMSMAPDDLQQLVRWLGSQAD